MAGRDFQFFAARSEVMRAVGELLSERRIGVVAIPDDNLDTLVAVKNATDLDQLSPEAWRIFVGEPPMQLQGVNPKNFSPSQLGWVQVFLPTVESGVLMMASVGTKAPPKKPPSIDPFNQLKKRLKMLKIGHVLVRNIVYGGLGRECPNIFISREAVAFTAKGGQLMQRGVENQRFFPVCD